MKKKSNTKWYILAGVVLAGAGAALSGGSSKTSGGETSLPLPPSRP
jgi:hypothetical protein